MTTLITTFPAVPNASAGRAAFVAAANKFGDDLTPFAQEINAVANEVNTKANSANASATNASTSATNAANSALAAQAAATATADTWVSGGAYALNALVWASASSGLLYRCILAHSGISTAPGSDPTRWALVLVDPARISAAESAINGLKDIPVTKKTAAYTLALADRGTCISTTAAVTIPANSAVAFPDGSTMMIRNTTASDISLLINTDTLRKSASTKTGTLTIPPYGTATIHKDAATTWYATGAN